MILLTALLAPAARAELPLECPPIVTLADANVYREYEGGVDAVRGQLYRAAMAWWDEDCAWVTTTTVTGTEESVEEVCDEPDRYVRRETYRVDDSSGGYDASGWVLEVEVPAGETWTRILVWSSSSSTSETSWAGGSGGSSGGSWTGSVEGLPDDGEVLAWSDSFSASGTYDDQRGFETPTCSMTWRQYRDGCCEDFEEVRTSTQVAGVYGDFGATACWRFLANVDGVNLGAADRTTWELLDDPDLDGFTADDHECDETDPTIHECAYETPNDGIDQDCDGADRVCADCDSDGYDGPTFGGSDCDDLSRSIHPGANEAPGNGRDEDCDGADDVDADDDGYTADGDADPADCDDADPDAYPGAFEVRYDGVDQDCDGTDLVDVDRDGAAAVEAGGLDCKDTVPTIGPAEPEIRCDGIDQNCDGRDLCGPPPSSPPEEAPKERGGRARAEGCFGGGAALLVALVPLARRRRRC